MATPALPSSGPPALTAKPSASQSAPERFDAAFFQRYYGNPATRVATREDQARLAAMIGGIAHYSGFRVQRMLDAGCGVGWLQAPLRRQFKGAEYVGLEVSEYLCRRHGWVQGSLPGYTDPTGFDLVICHDVLQYLPDREAAGAIGALARLSRGLLYFSVLTKADWKHNADTSRTDRGVHLRTGEWYRRRLRRHFRHLGCGVHALRTHEPLLWELETPWR
jgi:predicted TPR repeat methyltransferase